MLYDTKWDFNKNDPFDLTRLIAWLKTQDPEAEYCYEHPCECILASYLHATGFPTAVVGGWQWWPKADSTMLKTLISSEGRLPIPKRIVALAQTTPHTYGDVLKRAKRELKAQTKAKVAA